MGAFLVKKRTNKTRISKKSKKSRSSRKTRKSKRSRRYKQRGGDGSASWTPQTDRIGDPDAVPQVTSVEKYDKHKNNQLKGSY